MKTLVQASLYLLSISLSAAHSAETSIEAYWRFEESSALGTNTIPGSPSLETNGAVECVPVRGGALEMNPIPQTGEANGSMIFLPAEAGVLITDGFEEHLGSEFTVEAIIQPNVAGTFSVFASRFGDESNRSWRFGFNTTSATLHMGLSSNGESLAAFDTTLPAFRVNDFLYVAAVVKVDPSEGTTVTLYSKNLTQQGELIHSAVTNSSLTQLHHSSEPLIIGAASVTHSHKWIGALDEIRVSKKALRQEDLLVSPTQ